MALGLYRNLDRALQMCECGEQAITCEICEPSQAKRMNSLKWLLSWRPIGPLTWVTATGYHLDFLFGPSYGSRGAKYDFSLHNSVNHDRLLVVAKGTTEGMEYLSGAATNPHIARQLYALRRVYVWGYGTSQIVAIVFVVVLWTWTYADAT